MADNWDIEPRAGSVESEPTHPKERDVWGTRPALLFGVRFELVTGERSRRSPSFSAPEERPTLAQRFSAG